MAHFGFRHFWGLTVEDLNETEKNILDSIKNMPAGSVMTVGKGIVRIDPNSIRKSSEYQRLSKKAQQYLVKEEHKKRA